MNKQTILSSILSVALLTLVACSNDNNGSDGKEVDLTKAVEFKVDFADYNDKGEADITRAGSKAEEPVNLEQKTVQLDNGLFALCTLQRDTTKQTRPATTRALPNDTYTMLAYDVATHALKGEITGTVSDGAFVPADAKILLTPGNYEFVLFNSKVARSGNNLTVTRTDADAALIGRKTETIAATPKRQQISFTLKHVGAKVKIKLTGYMNFSGVTATLASVNATDIPSSSTYDASTGTWSTGAAAAVNENITYGANPEEAYKAETYTATSGDVMFMPSTDVSKLNLTFTAGNIYKQNMANASLTFNPKTSLQLEQNGAYVLNVKLMYNFLYLFSDGSTGFINETTYGGAPAATAKTPVAVVLSRSKRMAIALKKNTMTLDENYFTRWLAYDLLHVLSYSRASPDVIEMNTPLYKALLESPEISGKKLTWDPAYTSVYVHGEKVKAKRQDYPAFYISGHYDPGVAYSGSPALVWYLPTITDWLYAYTALGFGDKSKIVELDYRRVKGGWYGELANIAFKQVGGDAITVDNIPADGGLKLGYWTSTECFSLFTAGYTAPCSAIYVRLEKQEMTWDYIEKTHGIGKYGIRAFVEY